jgi:3-dehydroquinate dehydratase-1
MNRFCIGNLVLGALPRVVGTLCRRDSLAATHDAAGYACDIVEVRLDVLGHGSLAWLQECQAIERAGFPVILTLRLAAEGGKWEATDEAREAILSAAVKHLACVDIELTSVLRARLSSAAERLRKPVIISYHNFERTPDFPELREILERILAVPSAIPKISTMVTGDADVDTLKRLFDIQRARPRCIIGMGDKGTTTRVLFPSLGGCLAYGYFDSPVAPGQIPSGELMQRLGDLIPAYKEDLIARKKRAGNVSE